MNIIIISAILLTVICIDGGLLQLVGDYLNLFIINSEQRQNVVDANMAKFSNIEHYENHPVSGLTFK